ncbi:MAG: glycoside hydrolase family 71/99 protein, partial [Ignavibacteriaceae bacterium]
MGKNKLFRLWFILLYFLYPLVIEAQTWNVNPDFWTATDNLGRTTPTEQEAGATRSGKYIGMFYWTWHTDQNADFSPVINISQILKQDPSAATNMNDPAWGGIMNGGVFWWDEPLFGYYRTTDDWVLRKHAQMLADAGVDVVFFDCTNGSLTWKSSYTELLKVWEQARQDGVKTPQIAFLLNFGPTTTSLAEITELYTDLYQPGLYKDLWFMLNGKPLIMAYPEMLIAVGGSTAGLKFTSDSSSIGIDAACPSYSNNIGNLTLKLYKWNTNYSTTVAGTPIADSTFVNFNDNARLRLNFTPQPAGQYYWELSNGTEMVGVWKWNNTKDSVTSYFNGNLVRDGNYDSKIYLASGTVNNLTNDSGTGHTAVQILPGTNSTLVQNIKDFFTFRPGQPDYVNGPSRNDQWGWLEDYPQHGFGSKAGGG